MITLFEDPHWLVSIQMHGAVSSDYVYLHRWMSFYGFTTLTTDNGRAFHTEFVTSARLSPEEVQRRTESAISHTGCPGDYLLNYSDGLWQGHA